MNEPRDLHLTLEGETVDEAKVYSQNAKKPLSGIFCELLGPLIAQDKAANPAKYAPLRSQRVKRPAKKGTPTK